ncbi:hypothetical protein [Maioricimonas sp. JC845]|uniref:LptM family lipoprotein n=1 Tax=Maioricimonas sp. JC845 TaxID=3232138 RepID=UPI0034589222
MKIAFASLLSLMFMFTLSGCGGAPESDETANEAAQQLENDPDYEKEMMQHTQGGGN